MTSQTEALKARGAQALRQYSGGVDEAYWSAPLLLIRDLLAHVTALEGEGDAAIASLESLAWPKKIPQTEGGEIDVPAHFRSMAARIVQERDEKKHANRKLTASQADLRAALKTYGQHTYGCATQTAVSLQLNQLVRATGATCDCGFEAALAEISQPKEGDQR